MSGRPQKRTTCQACGVFGQFRGIELQLYDENCWEWFLVYLCAVCRTHLDQLVRPGGKRRLTYKRLVLAGAVPPAASTSSSS